MRCWSGFGQMLVPPATRCGGRGPSDPSRVPGRAATVAGWMSCSSDLFVFVWFSDNRRFTVFVRFAAVVLLFFIVISLLLGSRGGTAVLAKLCQVEMFTGLRGAMSTLVGCHGFTEGYYYESTAKGDLGVSALFPMSATIACTMYVPRGAFATLVRSASVDLGKEAP